MDNILIVGVVGLVAGVMTIVAGGIKYGFGVAVVGFLMFGASVWGLWTLKNARVKRENESMCQNLIADAELLKPDVKETLDQIRERYPVMTACGLVERSRSLGLVPPLQDATRG